MISQDNHWRLEGNGNTLKILKENNSQLRSSYLDKCKSKTGIFKDQKGLKMNISHVHSQGTPRGHVSTSKKQNNKGDMESRELETTKETGEGRGWSGGDVKF